MNVSTKETPNGMRIAFCILISVAALMRIALALHPGLWVDEIFSLAMATGHSLEHPANQAQPALGDYVEPADPQPPSTFLRYMQHDPSPAGLSRVIRAVRLSDTSPPLYYLLLNLWTRIFGTSDAALRLFSAACAIACFPVLWFVGLDLGGRRTAWAGCLVFTFCPLALYYSAEGRMYALVWFFTLLLAWSTLALSRRPPRPHWMALWILSAAAGLLTHYFFSFVVAACLVWLLLPAVRVSPLLLAGICVITALLILPWYLHLPEDLRRWRVTNGWLDYPLGWKDVILNPVKLAWSYLSLSGVWGGSRRTDILALGVFGALIPLTLRLGARRLFTERWRLLWLWLLASTLGPVAFDLLRGTNASSVARYALPGLPAAVLLVALGTSVLSQRVYRTFLILLPLIWLPAVRTVYAEPSRFVDPFPQVGNRLRTWTEPQDLIIVHSIPSGVLGVARYMQNSTPIVSWVVQLKQRSIPEDMNRFVDSRRRVALVKIHFLKEPSPAENWLLQHLKLRNTPDARSNSQILYFVRESP